MTRTPPHDLDLERVVLGSLLTAPHLLDEVVPILGSDAVFYQPTHAVVYRAILDAAEAGDPGEPYAIAARLAASGDLVRVGGAPFLTTLIEAVPIAAQAPYYARKVRDLALARSIEILARHAYDYAHTIALEDPIQAAERIRAELDRIDAGGDVSEFDPWQDVARDGVLGLQAAEQEGIAAGAVSTGLKELDDALNGGLLPGQVYVVAGRTSMGKSVLARNFVRAASFDQKVTTAMFSLEMTKQEIFNAVVSAELSLELSDVSDGNLTDAQWTRVARWLGETEDTPLFIDDNCDISLAQIRVKLRRLSRKRGLGLVVIDYLQLVEMAGRENRQVAVADLSRGLKKLAKEFMCPVVVLSQLNRGPEHRTDKRPNIADLRESGAIENDANVIILIHREEYYDKNSTRKGEADLIIAKNRGGRPQDVLVAAPLHLARFSSMGLT